MNKYLIIFIASFLTSSCLEKNLSYDYPQDPSYVRKNRAGKFFTKDNSDIVLYGKDKKEQDKKELKKPEKEPEKTIIYKKSTNQLWNASIEVISEILPISIIDSNAKLISTDWYQNDSLDPNKRIKINLVIKDSQINEENIVLSVFRQKKDQKGQWQDDKIDESIIKSLKTKIVSRANQIN